MQHAGGRDTNLVTRCSRSVPVASRASEVLEILAQPARFRIGQLLELAGGDIVGRARDDVQRTLRRLGQMPCDPPTLLLAREIDDPHASSDTPHHRRSIRAAHEDPPTDPYLPCPYLPRGNSS